MRNHAVDVGDLSCPARVENRACPGWALPVPLGRDAGVRGGGFWNPRTQQWGRGTGVESAGRTRGPQPCAWGQTDFTSRPASPGFGTWAGRSPGPSFLRGSHEVCETSHGGSIRTPAVPMVTVVSFLLGCLGEQSSETSPRSVRG